MHAVGLSTITPPLPNIIQGGVSALRMTARWEVGNI